MKFYSEDDALDNIFLVDDSGIQVVKNFSRGIHRKGTFVNFGNGNNSSSLVHSTSKKALLMKVETNMLMMSSMITEKPRLTGLHRLDIVTDWKFEKDATDLKIRDKMMVRDLN